MGVHRAYRELMREVKDYFDNYYSMRRSVVGLLKDKDPEFILSRCRFRRDECAHVSLVHDEFTSFFRIQKRDIFLSLFLI